MTGKMNLELELKDLCLLACALGHLEGAVARRDDSEVKQLLSSMGLNEFFENKNEMTAAIRDLNKRCAAQVDAQH